MQELNRLINKPILFDLIKNNPTDDPNKVVLLNTIAFLAGMMLPCVAPISLSLPLLGAGIAYTWYEELKTEQKPTILKTTHAAMAVFSFTAGALSGNLVFSALVIKNLFTAAIATRHPMRLLSGFKMLAYTIGFTYPITALINRAWFHSVKTLHSYTKEGASMLTQYALIRQIILHPSVTMGNTEDVLHWIKTATGSDFDNSELILKTLEKTTDEEFAHFIIDKVATGQFPIAQIGDLSRFKHFYETSIKGKALDAIKFCNELEQRIDSVKDNEGLEKLQNELTQHTQNALWCRKILAHFPICDPDNQARMLQDLNTRYETFLTNIDQNTYRGKLRAKAAFFIEEEVEDDADEDVIFLLPDIFRENDCQVYVKTLQLTDVAGKSYANIFHDELVRLGIDTRGGLSKAGYFPMPATVEDKKAKLIEIVKNEQNKLAPTQVIRDFTHGNSTSVANTNRSVVTVAKRVFFQISMYGSAAIMAVNNPITVLMAAGSAIKYQGPSAFIRDYEPLLPTAVSFANCHTVSQHARQYASTISAYSNPFFIGFKIGTIVRNRFA